jgi:2',3'-cyclic-nucleotide 2'-phosphodiesterase (5'-nucleotidase family)
MTSQSKSGGQGAAGPTSRRFPIWGPWAILGVIVVALVLFAAVGPDRLVALVANARVPKAQGPVSLTILHTNDTWGYVFPCG